MVVGCTILSSCSTGQPASQKLQLFFPPPMCRPLLSTAVEHQDFFGGFFSGMHSVCTVPLNLKGKIQLTPSTVLHAGSGGGSLSVVSI